MKKTYLFLLIICYTSAMVAQIDIDIAAPEVGFRTYNIGQPFTTITVDANNNVWAGTDKQGIFFLDTSLDLVGTFSEQNIGTAPALNTVKIESMAADKLGNVWVGHSGTNFSNGVGGMERIAIADQSVQHISPDRNAQCFQFFERDGLGTLNTKAVSVDVNNTVWAAQWRHSLTSGGTFILTPGTLSYKPSNATKFTAKSTWEDYRAGNQSAELPYPAYTCNPDITETPQSRNINAVASDSTQVWIGTFPYVTKDTEEFLPSRLLGYDLSGNYLSQINFTFADVGFSPGGVFNAIYRNNSKGTWVTSSVAGKGFSVYKEGVWKYMNPSVDSIQKIIPPDTRFNNNAIWGNAYGNVFMGTDKGILVYDGRGPVDFISSYTLYSREPRIPNSPFAIVNPDMISDNIFGGSAQEDRVQWIVTDSGIMKGFIGTVSTGQCPLVAQKSTDPLQKIVNSCEGVDFSDPRSVGNVHINFVEDQLEQRSTSDPTYHFFTIKTVICSPSSGPNQSLCSVENIYQMFKKNSGFQAIIPKDLPDEVLGDDFLRELVNSPDKDALLANLLEKTNSQTEKITSVNDLVQGTLMEAFIEENLIFEGIDNRGFWNILGGFVTDAPDERNSVDYYTNLQLQDNLQLPEDGDQSVNGEEYRLYNVQAGIDTRDIFVKNYPSGQFMSIQDDNDCEGIGLESIYYDPIIMFVDDKNYKMVNYTKEGHIFYPGKIVRTVKRDTTTGEVYVETIGVGFHFCSGEVGQLVAATNAMVGPVVFKNVDFRLKKAFEELSSNE